MSPPTPPTVGEHLVVSFPAPKTLLIRMNRPQQLNAMTDEMEEDMRRVLDWAEEEVGVWVTIVTGTGRVFCAGQDLKGWLAGRGTAKSPDAKIQANPFGFGSLARRQSNKTIIVAMNGSALGGGAEIVVNCDVVVAAAGSVVCFPEVRRGVVASVGGIPNLILRSPAMAPWLLAGLPIPQKLLEQHLITEFVPAADVLPAALAWAARIVECSPDAVWVTKSQINMFKNGMGIDEIVMKSVTAPESTAMYQGENLEEGLRSFVEKRPSVWKDPKPLRSKL